MTLLKYFASNCLIEKKWGQVFLFLLISFLMQTVPVKKLRAYENREFEIKAVFITKFSKFITWPRTMHPATGSNLNIGFIGKGPLVDNLKSLDGKKIEGRVIRIIDSSGKTKKEKLHVLVISSDQGPDFRSKVKRAGKGVLTIGDADGFCEQGGMINFYMKSDKVRFEINIEAVKKSGIKISSKLLRLARIVEKN